MCYCDGYSGLAIADYFIEKAVQDKKAITNMHVLKMIYFAQAFSFSELNRKLIKDDFYAWKWGPVEIKTYQEFKHFGPGPITEPSGRTNVELSDIKGDPKIVSFLDKLYKLVDANPFKLSDLTHVAGGPWDITPIYRIIEPDKISSFYGRRQEVE